MSLRRICDVIVWRNVRLRSIGKRFLVTKSTELTESKNETVDITTADEEPMYMDDPQFQQELDRKRNKSRLNPQHRNILMGIPPYDHPLEWFHNTVRYKKRMLGRYGLKGNAEPAGFAWPTPKDVQDIQEYEGIAFPLSIRERWKKLDDAKRIKAEQIQAREAEITEKLAKMDQWTAELNAKVTKRKAELEAARLRKERLVEEVRKQLGFKISPQDERFKTLLAQKEKEDRKKKKEAKKKAQLEKLTSKPQDMSSNASQEDQAIESTKSEK